MFDTCLDLQDALPDLEDAVMAAEASRHDEIAIEASVMLGSAFADLAHDVRLGRQWVRLGEAILARFPGHPLLNAWVTASRGNVLVRAGKFEEALRDEQRALEIQQFVLGPSNIEVAMSANNIAMVLHELGRDEEAEQSIRRAGGIFAGVLGEESGRVAIASLNECEILTSLGRFEAANAALRKALRIWRQQDASTFYIGAGLLDEGRLELAQHNPGAAVAPLEEALRRLGTQDPHLTAEARFALAQALMATAPRDGRRALELARAARDAMASDPSAVGLVRKIDAWQAAHTGPRDASL
jgi:tetratricopeptide (TPR) repeat protein